MYVKYFNIFVYFKLKNIEFTKTNTFYKDNRIGAALFLISKYNDLVSFCKLRLFYFFKY